MLTGRQRGAGLMCGFDVLCWVAGGGSLKKGMVDGQTYILETVETGRPARSRKLASPAISYLHFNF